MRRAGCALSSRAFKALLCCVWFVTAPSGVAADEPAQRLTAAQIVLGAGSTPPNDDAHWQAQSLPDNWNASRPGTGGEAWYRITFHLTPAQRVLSALYIPRWSMSGEAYLNGERLGGADRWSEPRMRQWYLPQIFALPASLLRAGTNVVHVHLFAYANNKGGLSEVHVGPAPTVTEQWRRRYFWGVTAVQITSALTLGLGALALLAWTLRRWNTAYGYFGAAALLWAVRNLHFMATDIPIGAVLWEVLVATSLVWVLLLICMFGLRFAGQSRPLVERGIFAFGVGAPFLLYAAGALQLTLAIGVCYTALLAVALYVLVILCGVMWRERNLDAALLAIAASLVYLLGLHDWVTQRDLLNFSEPYNLHFGAPIMFTAVAWNMFRRFTKAQARADDLTRTLEARVRQKSDKLEQSYRHMQHVEAARTLAIERERIMRDMHDGVGSQLISAHQLAQRGALKPEELTALLQDCIDDLRLVIDSLEPVDGDLLTLLANLRYRITDRLARQGIALKWEAADLPMIRNFAPHDTLQVLRIVQEAITNVIKHAHASEVVISIAPIAGAHAVQLTVRDNGQGHGDMAVSNLRASGRGLANMKQRARSLGAELQVHLGVAGATVSLTVPLALPGNCHRPGA